MEKTSKMIGELLDKAYELTIESPIKVEEFIILADTQYLLKLGSELRNVPNDISIISTEPVRNMVTWSFRLQNLIFHAVEVVSYRKNEGKLPIMFATRGMTKL